MGILVPSFSFVCEAGIPRKAQIWEKPCSPSLAYTNKDWDFFSFVIYCQTEYIEESSTVEE